MPRFFCPVDDPAGLGVGQALDLPAGAARHVQVLRMQPGESITLFTGNGGQWTALIEQMGRSSVSVRMVGHEAVEREAIRGVHLALGMPANERMDWLLEKATELGACSFQPLHTERGVLRVQGDRATRKLEHWRAVAASACEQCGRNRVPVVHPVQDLGAWLSNPPAHARLVLSLDPEALTLGQWRQTHPEGDVLLLSGPEGGLSAREETLAREAGFCPVGLGPRVLRAETAPLAALSALTL